MNWNANWVWIPNPRNPNNLYVHARREIAVPSAVKARIYVSAGQLYQLFVNGRFVGRGPNPADVKRYYYDVYDVELRAGANVLAATCYTYGPKAHGVIFQNYGPAGLLLEMRDSSDRPIVVTDDSWRVTQATEWDQDAPVNCTLYGDFKEYYDSRKEPAGWMSAAFDDSAWTKPALLGRPPGGPYPNLVEREIPQLSGERRFPANAYIESASVTYAWRDDWEIYHEQKLIPGTMNDQSPKPVEIKKTHPDFSPSLILDFGRDVTGYPEISIKNSGGGIIDVLYGEDLHLVRVDRFILKGGAEVLQPFNRRTFRYMKLLFQETPQRIEIDRVSIDMNTFPVKYEGEFSCSDPLLGRIWDVGRYTIHMSMLDHFVDCPWRERTIYGGDVYAENLIAHYAFGDPRLNRKTLRQMFAIQFEDGALPPLGPYSGFDHFYPSWSAFFGLAFLDHYQLTGDREFLAEGMPNLRKLLEWTAREIEANEPHMVGWPAEGGDHAKWMSGRKQSFGAWDVFPFLLLLQRSAGVLAELGDASEAKRCESAAALMAGEIRKHMVNAEGLCVPYPTRGQPTQADAAYLLWSNLLPRGQGEAAGERALAADIPGIGTPFQGIFLLEGLFNYGRDQRALDFIRSFWGSLLARGATTFWEHFQANWPKDFAAACGQSLCHGWSAAPTYVLGARVLGVRPLSPGFAKVLIAPSPCDLAWAKGVVPTPHGPVRVSWRRNADRFDLDYTLPPGCEADVRLPELPRSVRRYINGREVPAQAMV